MSADALPRSWRALRDRLAARLADDALAVRVIAALHDTTPAMVRARGDTAVDAADVMRADAAARRLAAGEPFAYAVGSAAFRLLTLHVDARVLIPRPETETVVEVALACAVASPGGTAVDIGTGSGAIALSLACEGRFDRVIATDVSADALDVARANAARIVCATPVEFRLGADLAPLAAERARGERCRLIVANPPYIAPAEMSALPRTVRDWEPPTALVAGEGGLANSRTILAAAPALLESGGHVVLEIDARRAAETTALAHGTGAYDDVRVHADLFGRPRVLVARRAASSD